MKRLIIVAVPAMLLTFGVGHGTATVPSTLLVDDDGVECADAGFTSIQAAVDAAAAGDTVRVCPGLYTEFAQINKPLTLLGQPDAVASIDCFDPSTSQADDLDPTRFAIIERPQDQPGNLVTASGAGVIVDGLVLQGATTTSPPDSIYDAAVHLQSSSAGARVRHNLIRLNSLGIDLGSDGTAATRVEENCFRDNRWAIASQRQDFTGGTVDSNETFRHTDVAYEIGWRLASTRQSMFTGNVSRQDATTFFLQNSSSVSIVDNDAEPTRRGVLVTSGNEHIAITGNRIVGGSQLGVFFQASAVPSQDAVVSGNDIAGFGPGAPGFAIGLGTNTLNQAAIHGVEIQDNVLRNNNVGLSVNPNNTGIVVRDNTVTGNAQQGIFSRARVVGARYEDNILLGNAPVPGQGLADARDDNRAANVWVDNVCQTDIPTGTICGVE